MNELEKPIGRVWRRLRFQRFLSALVWCWGGTLLVVAIAIAVEKFADRPLPGADWVPFAIAGGAGLVLAALIAGLSGPSRVDAAVAIDRVFQLNERLSTALTLPESLRATPAGQALLADTIRHVGNLDINVEFAPMLPRTAWVPLIPAVLALSLLFVQPLLQKTAAAKPSDLIEKKLVVDQTKALGKKIASQRKELEKGKFAEADKLLAEIEKAAEDLAKAPPAQKDKALVELNKLTDAVKDRQKKLGSSEQIDRQLQQLKQMASSGPADDFARDLAKGEFQKAADELKKIQEKLKSGKMTEADKKGLQEQLKEMSKQLEKLANLDQRKQQLEEARKNGGLSEGQFKQEMAKLEEQAKNLQQLQKLASKLGQAGEQLQKGDVEKAAAAMGVSQKQLSEMASQLQELESLDGALADLQEAKNGMAGDQANQLGDSLSNMMGMGSGNRRGMGQGLGRGRGQGDRPEAPDDTNTYTAQVKQQMGKGKAVLKGYGPTGNPLKGQSVIDIQAEMATTEGLSAEALTNQKVPKNVEKHIRGYFDQINKGR
ncbi:hypothetical protein SAMN05444166_6656 [Singulisphaera sp. GP187]|uniref:hypothetical protein n=1 Tax=Singulisphaera sp. GP187 TaxID=1882752 RepID=UPI0009258814|nr:hypothetical protein [Singulisphaera sp. GP187]SIO61146.1 hypothetical protein SAMN05444166_6656 [Singulisphaera sp. GP187]